MNFFDISLRIAGFDLAAARHQLQKIQTELNKNPLAYRERKKSEIVTYHLQHNAFYKQLVGNTSTKWEELPILTKTDLQQPLAHRLSDGHSVKNSHIHKTSGSGGTPFIFAKDKPCHALSWAAAEQLYEQAGINTRRSLQARFYGIPARGLSHYKERLKDKLSYRYRLPIFDLSEKNMAYILKQFRQKPFGHINGYTSAIVYFAKYLQENKLILKELCPTLTQCVVTAEMLYPDDLVLLERQLGVPVYNEYGASETSILAFGKASDPLPILHTLFYIEVLDESNNPVEPGNTGRLVVTSFFNKAHPFIRYEIGDLGAIVNEKQQPSLQQLEGRSSDFVRLENGKVIPGLAFYYMTKTIITDTSPIKEFVVTQTHLDRFTIAYVSKTPIEKSAKAKIHKALSQYIGKGLSLQFDHKDFLDRSARGKLKQFTSLIN